VRRADGQRLLPVPAQRGALSRGGAKDTVPGALNATYYAQRADAAILISEGTHPAPIGQGYLE
jgi:N-ethylmaleimide reductase